MKWIKLGKIISPLTHLSWSKSHCWVPFADHQYNDVYRIYFATRNAENFSQVGWVEIDIFQPTKILNYSESPTIKLGALGTFDDSAVLPSWITYSDGKKYFWYIAWMQGKRVPYYASLGLAVSSKENPDEFVKYLGGPMLPRNDIDPYMTASACVLKVREGHWKMWYLSNTQWKHQQGNEIPAPRYHLKYAESVDGLNWVREGIIAIDFKNDGEYAISRPSVIIEDDIYKMWYSYRGENYRIGYAESNDGINWVRMDDSVGIDTSRQGFDSEMIEYPHVFDHKGQRFMLYNGNNFGQEGIGLATLER
jgi:hypothetical protein